VGAGTAPDFPDVADESRTAVGVVAGFVVAAGVGAVRTGFCGAGVFVALGAATAGISSTPRLSTYAIA